MRLLRSLYALLGSLLIPFAALLFYWPHYQTNDDVAMRLLAEGHFVPGGEPTPFLLHINIIIGWFLNAAYRLAPTMPWYDLLMGASLTLASAVLLDSWLGSRTLGDVLWTVLFALFFLLPMFVSVQFALVALTCGAAGAVCIIRGAMANSSPLRFILGSLLLIVGGLIRYDAAVLGLIEGALLGLALLACRTPGLAWRPFVRRAGLAFGIAIIAIGGFFVLNHRVYSNEHGWSQFLEYNFRRSLITEYSSQDRLTPKAIERLGSKVGWSRNDFALFCNWFFTDRTLYSLDNVRRAEAFLNSQASDVSEPARAARLNRAMEQGRLLLHDSRYTIAFTLLLVATRFSARLVVYFGILSFVVVGLIIGITIVFKSPPERILWPMLLLAASMLAIAAQQCGATRHRLITVLSGATAIYLTVSACMNLAEESVRRRNASNLAAQDAERLKRSGASFFVLHGNAFPYEDFWRPLHVEATPFPFVALGVSARTPPVQNALLRTGRSDLPYSLCTDPSLVLVAPPYITQFLTTFLQEHRRLAVRFDPVDGGRLTAWKCAVQ